MRRLLPIAIGAAAALVIATQSLAASSGEAPPSQTPYIIATSPAVNTWGTPGWGGPVTSLDLTLCVGDGALCPSVWAPTLAFGPLTEALVGTTIWNDASASTFDGVAALLTDGQDEQVNVNVGLPWGWQGIGMVESLYFGDQVGPNGIDLAGYTLDRIGFRVDSVWFGAESGWSLNGTFLFEGTIACVDSCKEGGWAKLRGPTGTFRNEGDCVQFAITGK